jgi:hypothetical protein
VLIATEVRLAEERARAELEAARLIEDARRQAGRSASGDAPPGG